MNKQWLGVDLDGTLAYYAKWSGIEHIGEPISNIKELLLVLHSKGVNIKIFTARIAEKGAIKYIKQWLKNNDFPNWEITNIKDMHCVEIWDDRCVQVIRNTGKLKGESSILKNLDRLVKNKNIM
jgi:hypothetical protein